MDNKVGQIVGLLDNLAKQIKACSDLCDEIALIALPTDKLPMPPTLDRQEEPGKLIADAQQWTLGAISIHSNYRENYEMVIGLVQIQEQLLTSAETIKHQAEKLLKSD